MMRIRSRHNKALAALWFDALFLGVEANMVIGLRCAKLALNGTGCTAERRLMVAEKAKAASAAQLTTIKSLVTGSGNRAGNKVVKLYRRRVRANLRRLAKGK
jgi:acyl-CoA reductase-like NAD-dependent aldehyde dehydrogenase